MVVNTRRWPVLRQHSHKQRSPQSPTQGQLSAEQQVNLYSSQGGPSSFQQLMTASDELSSKGFPFFQQIHLHRNTPDKHAATQRSQRTPVHLDFLSEEPFNPSCSFPQQKTKLIYIFNSLLILPVKVDAVGSSPFCEITVIRLESFLQVQMHLHQ